jgi:hypothetical protein
VWPSGRKLGHWQWALQEILGPCFTPPNRLPFAMCSRLKYLKPQAKTNLSSLEVAYLRYSSPWQWLTDITVLVSSTCVVMQGLVRKVRHLMAENHGLDTDKELHPRLLTLTEWLTELQSLESKYSNSSSLTTKAAPLPPTCRKSWWHITQSKMDWRCGSSGRTPALQVWDTKFKFLSHKMTGSHFLFSFLS